MSNYHGFTNERTFIIAVTIQNDANLYNEAILFANQYGVDGVQDWMESYMDEIWNRNNKSLPLTPTEVRLMEEMNLASGSNHVEYNEVVASLGVIG